MLSTTLEIMLKGLKKTIIIFPNPLSAYFTSVTNTYVYIFYNYCQSYGSIQVHICGWWYFYKTGTILFLLSKKISTSWSFLKWKDIDLTYSFKSCIVFYSIYMTSLFDQFPTDGISIFFHFFYATTNNATINMFIHTSFHTGAFSSHRIEF